jgi:hypothetical protein
VSPGFNRRELICRHSNVIGRWLPLQKLHSRGIDCLCDFCLARMNAGNGSGGGGGGGEIAMIIGEALRIRKSFNIRHGSQLVLWAE